VRRSIVLDEERERRIVKPALIRDLEARGFAVLHRSDADRRAALIERVADRERAIGRAK
jgi:hypothetical protein